MLFSEGDHWICELLMNKFTFSHGANHLATLLSQPLLVPEERERAVKRARSRILQEAKYWLN